jgi:NAD(P)-dependent dehydrogenase (short-subunit alcohol dehydrogenase family)
MAKTSRRTKIKVVESGFRKQAQKTARRERSIQRKIDRRDKRRGKPDKKQGAMQAGARRYPEPKLPADKPAKLVETFGGDTPMGRPAQPEEIAPAFVFLAAPCCSSYITGEILPIIGGYSGG